MSDLLNSASLVLIPSGYAEDKVYSAVPTDGSGDLSFTRASNGTRINSAGLVEVCPWNLVQYSNTFNNVVWPKAGTTLTSGQTDPNGGANAWKVEFAAGGSYLYQPGIISTGVVTMSAYLRADSTTTIGFNDGSAYPNSVTIGTTWQRYEFSFNVTIGNTAIQFDNYFGVSPANLAKTFYIWGAQLNIGSTAKPYFPTTDRLNVPRLTYQNGGGGCPSLLLEKQSTNLVLNSQNLTGASWTTSGNTLTANYATSPDGTSNASRIIPTTNNQSHPTYAVITVGAATSITSFFKADGYNFGQIYGGDAGGSSATRFSVVVNLSTGAIDTIDTITSGQVAIVAMGNGWWKVTISNFTQFTSGNYFVAVAAIPSSGLSKNSFLDVIFSGNGTSGILVYGIQVEESSYPTSYIPTTSASATRVADACSKTGISSLIGQTQGTMFCEINTQQSPANNWFQITDGTADNWVFIGMNTDKLVGYVRLGSSTLLFDQSFTFTNGVAYKMALRYKSGDIALYINGNAIAATSATYTVSASISQIVFGDLLNPPNDSAKYSQAIIFPTALTNAELAQLTA
jgi:hypothetical protein